MVDEFQDSNPRQLEVLAALDSDNLFTVGDELQSIYGFRHADICLFRERHERLAARGASLALTHNFRSRPQILAAVRRIFAPRIGERFAPPVATRATGPTGEPIVELLLTDRRGWDAFPGDRELEGLPEATPWRQAEARLLASRIGELITAGHASAGEIVVLLRALGDLPVYESALRHHGLSTLAGVGGFWSHQQVGDLLSWLRALANPLDELALYSTLASPLAGVSSDGLASIARYARERGRNVWEALSEPYRELSDVLPSADRQRVSTFREMLLAERPGAARRPISELLRRAIALTGYDAHVLSLGWGERRLANVHKLIRLARQFEAREGRDLRGFLDHVAHVEESLGGREADAPVGDAQLDAVRLMSIHAAKGLEFPVVCVADLGRELNLRVPDLLVDAPSARAGLRLHELGNPEPSSALEYDTLREESRAAQEQEEDRVLYVACTRAEDRLLLSGTVSFERWPEQRPGVAPIAWLAPALVPDAPALAGSPRTLLGGLTVEVGEGLSVRCTFNSPSGIELPNADEVGPAADPSKARHGRIGASEAPPNSDTVTAPTGEVGEQLEIVLPATSSHELTIRPTSTPVPLEDPNTAMSYTSLAELERCGYRYYLERVLRLPENRAATGAHGGAASDEDDGGVRARARGTIVHVLLESVDFTHPTSPSGEDVERVARLVGASLSATERDEILALISTALAAPPARLLGGTRRAHREYPFSFALASNEPLVTGVLDLLAEQPDGSSLIVDYKSDRLSGEEDLERLVMRDYGFQRLLYALAAIEAGAPSVEVAHWFLEQPQKWVSARFTSEERLHLREQLSARIARVRAKGFAVTDIPHRKICLTCPGRGGLCSWGETHTMSERSTTLESRA